MKLKSLVLLLILIECLGCQSQTPRTMKQPETNPLLCDPEKGICEVPATNAHATNLQTPTQQKPVKIIYFTDPICSSCWGIEPQLRKLKLEYGDAIEIDYRMGGLLPDWSYNSGGISKPSDVAHHWDEVSAYYDMPIDGNVWLEDPLNSSYPPSIAMKAAQMQDSKKAVIFLRRIREMVFLEKKNITRWEHLVSAAQEAGLDTTKLKVDYEGVAKALFEADLNLGRSLGVRGFPTLIFSDATNRQQMVYGFKPYTDFENAIRALHPAAVKQPYDSSLKGLFAVYPTLTAKEFSVLSGLPTTEAVATLDQLVQEHYLTKMMTRNGAIWKIKR